MNKIKYEHQTMRKIMIVAALLLCLGNACCFAQADNREKCGKECAADSCGMIDDDEKPTYPGGQKALIKFLRKNLSYPSIAAKYGVEGKVKMRVILSQNGEILETYADDCIITRFDADKFGVLTQNEQQVLKKELAREFAKEGFRTIKKMPKWTPAKNGDSGKKIRITIPLTFKGRN